MSRTSRVALLFGGRSVEHEVSVISARGVARAMGQTELECVPVGVTEQGRWLSPKLSRAILDGDAPRVEGPDEDAGHVVADPGGRGLFLVDSGGAISPIPVDVAFPLIHGQDGEDGRIQGLFDLAGIPYVGPGLRGSAVAMDKELSKRLFESRGLPVGPWLSTEGEAYRTAPAEFHERVVAETGFPAFVKPANGGSSVGISRVTGEEQLGAAIEDALRYDGKVVVERGLDAREIECAVLGNVAPQPSVLGEIVPSGTFYDYAAMYLDDASELIIPAELPDDLATRIREMAVEAFRALDLRGLARVDFLVCRKDGELFLNEANTLPGFTPISMFPKLWEASGLAYPELIVELVRLATFRHSCAGFAIH